MSTQTLEPPTVANGSATAPAPTPPAPFVSGGESLYPGHPHPNLPPGNAVEVRKPSAASLDAHWVADLRDSSGVPPNSIISVRDPFTCWFHVWLSGDLWRCICGHWCFDVHFESIGGGTEMSLSDVASLEPELTISDWTGCAPGALHFWKRVTVPAGTIPAGEKNKPYLVTATFQMLDPCRKPVPVVGIQPLGEFLFYNPS